MGSVSQNLLSQSPQNISIPSIVVYELEVGIAKSTTPQKRIKQLYELLTSINIISFAQKEAKKSANIRAKLEKQGTSIGPYDTLIAGTAVSHQLTLVTHNISEFQRVDKLQIEDWF